MFHMLLCFVSDVEEPPTFDSPSTFGPPTSCPSPAVPAEYPSPVEPKTYSTPGFLPQPASPFRVSAPPSPLLLEHCIPDDHDSAHHSGVAMEPPEKIRKQILGELSGLSLRTAHYFLSAALRWTSAIMRIAIRRSRKEVRLCILNIRSTC